MESRPFVTIVSAFFNTASFLDEAIESVLAQTYPRWELLLVDDGSEDGSSDIAQRYAGRHPDRIKYIEHANHENRGAAASRNVGVRAATGKYVAILDGDDVWLPHKLERQVAILEAEPRAAMVCGASLYWRSWTGNAEDATGDVVTTLGIACPKLYDPPELMSLLYPLGEAGAPCPSDILLRRDLMEPGGGFEEHFHGPLQLYEDQAFLVKIYLKHSVFVTDELWDRYRVHPGSCVSEVTAAGQHDAVRQFFLRWLDRHLAEEHGPSYTRRVLGTAGTVEPSTGMGTVLSPARWSLRVADRNEASVTFPAGGSHVLRVAIGRVATPTAHDIQLNQPRLRVQGGGRYQLRFRGRADTPRRVAVGFAKGGAPWSNLGLYQSIELAQEWGSFLLPFTVPVSEDNGRIHFDLGGSAIAVELSDVTLEKTSGVHASNTIVQASHVTDADAMEPVSSDWGWDRGLPIDRYYIDRFLTTYAADIRGAVVEIGDDHYTRRFGGTGPITVDVLDVDPQNRNATIVADLSNAPEVPASKFDCILLPQTLQFVYDTRAAIATSHRMLRPGGVVLATLPSATALGESRSPWYWGFTAASARRLFEETFPPENITLKCYGNLVAVTSFLRGMASEELTAAALDRLDERFIVLVCVRAERGADTRVT